MRLHSKIGFLLGILLLLGYGHSYSQAPSAARWPAEKARQWDTQQPWLMGCNYIPATAINQLEMWQADTFDPSTIDKELGWAANLGMNTVRVFLHDLLWQQDSTGFLHRMDQFLGIATRHHIKPLFVFFDSCWDPYPHVGKQGEPRPGVHNSGWVQSPGLGALKDTRQYPRLESYVKGIIRHFRHDNRILGWDVWNEPDNSIGSPGDSLEHARKVALVTGLLAQSFQWIRAAEPSQPLTSGVYSGDWSSLEKLRPIEKVQIENSDILSFHSYDGPQEFEKRIQWLLSYQRPVLCTEYMARGNGSTFQGTLPIAKHYRVAAYCWGFVKGRSQTNFPWDSWQKPYVDREPTVWFHDLLYADGRPYRPSEVRFIRKMTRLSTGTHPNTTF